MVWLNADNRQTLVTLQNPPADMTLTRRPFTPTSP